MRIKKTWQGGLLLTVRKGWPRNEADGCRSSFTTSC